MYSNKEFIKVKCRWFDVKQSNGFCPRWCGTVKHYIDENRFELEGVRMCSDSFYVGWSSYLMNKKELIEVK